MRFAKNNKINLAFNFLYDICAASVFLAVERRVNIWQSCLVYGIVSVCRAGGFAG